jgi:hypothetical protein
MRAVRSTWLQHATLVAALALAAGCEPDGTVAPLDQPDKAFWATKSAQEAITLALTPEFDTLQLDVRPINPFGVPLEGLPAPVFFSTNVNAVEVNANGRLHAVGLTPGTQLYTSVTYNGVTHADTIVVAVTDDPGTAIPATFSMQPQAGDSARYALGGSLLEPFKLLTPTIEDGDGNPLSGFPVRFTTLDNRVALVDANGGNITGIRRGYVKFAGDMWAYNRHFADTVNYRIQRAGYAKVNVYGPFYALVPHVPGSFQPDSIEIGVGGVVEFENTGMLPATIIRIKFDPSQQAFIDSVPEQSTCVQYGIECDTRGDIDPFGPPDNGDPDFNKYYLNLDRARRFTAPGVYPVSDSGWGTHMKIVVVDETAP